ncbi:MAG: hypothetical protein AB7U61_09290 [Methylocystis sp.]
MKQNWLRLIVSAMVIVAALWGAASSFAAPVAHSCVGMSAGEDCPDHPVDHTAALRHCDSLICEAGGLAGEGHAASLIPARREDSVVDPVAQRFIVPEREAAAQGFVCSRCHEMRMRKRVG